MTVRIQLLGGVGVLADGDELVPPSNAKATALLVWLALNPGQHPRSWVASLLWPEVLDESARASLRTAIWALRRSLDDAGSALQTSRESVGFTEDEVHVDVHELRELIEDGQLGEAAELAQAELAPGVVEEWLDPVRDAHRMLLDGLYERLAASAEESGDPASAVVWTRRRVWIYPLAEETQQALLRRLVAVGDRAGALHAFARFRTRLRVELGLAPSAETRLLVDQIRAIELGSAELPARLAAVRNEVLVGRAAELELLLGHWERARESRLPAVVAIAAGPGVGKTRLIAELAMRVQSAGHRVAYGASASEAIVPHQPFVEALSEGVGAVLEELEEGAEVDPAGARRYRLFERVATLVGELAKPAAALVALDDLQWADLSTTQLLRHVARSHKARGVLIVLAYRPGELGSGPLADVLMDLNREVPLERIVLRGLTEAEVATLIRGWGSDATDAQAQALHDRTDGNPFFVRELMRDLAEGRDRAETVPQTILEVVRTRLARLDSGAQALLAAGAVAGPTFDALLANAALDQPATTAEVVSTVDVLVGAGLIDDSEPGGLLRFEHTLVREAIYGNLSSTRRASLHLALAERIVDLRGSGPGLHLAEIARHYRAAGSTRAVEWTISAADYAFSRLAFDQAGSLYGQAIAALNPGDPRRSELVGRRAVVSQLMAHALIDLKPKGGPT